MVTAGIAEPVANSHLRWTERFLIWIHGADGNNQSGSIVKPETMKMRCSSCSQELCPDQKALVTLSGENINDGRRVIEADVIILET